MSDTPETERGMDLFDFLYEIWKEKWLFAAIVAGFLAAAIASALFAPDLSALRHIGQTDETRGRIYSESALYRFRIFEIDPLQREPDELLRDLMDHTYADFGLVQLEDNILREFFPSTTEQTMFFENAGQTLLLAVDLGSINPEDPDDFIDYGQIRALATRDGVDLSTGFLPMLQAAARRQAVTAAETMQREQAAIGRVIDTVPLPQTMVMQNVTVPEDGKNATFTSDAWFDWAAERVYNAELFQSNPDVGSEDLAFIEILPQRGRVSGAGVLSGLVRSVVVAGLLGLIVAVLTIMFRIGIRRGRGAV